MEPNKEVKLVFKEEWNEEEGIMFMNIFLEAPGREITPLLISQRGDELPDGPTVAELWGFEMLEFIQAYIREQLQQGQMGGYLLKVPKKKDMN